MTDFFFEASIPKRGTLYGVHMGWAKRVENHLLVLYPDKVSLVPGSLMDRFSAKSSTSLRAHDPLRQMGAFGVRHDKMVASRMMGLTRGMARCAKKRNELER